MTYDHSPESSEREERIFAKRSKLEKQRKKRRREANRYQQPGDWQYGGIAGIVDAEAADGK